MEEVYNAVLLYICSKGIKPKGARLFNFKNLLQFSLDYIQNNIKRKESNISFLISSYLNYGGTLNGLVTYNTY
jgi:hypothetical protein